MQPELIADYACITGENPLWNPLDQRLYWLDIEDPRMFRYDPATGQHEQFFSGEQVGGFTIQEDGALLLFLARGAIKHWQNGNLTTLIDEIPAERESRFNDVIADPEGRVFCGSMPGPNGPGRLYRLDCDGTLTVVLEGIGCSNGMGFTPDRRGMYYTDSAACTITRFDYDQSSGTISNGRVFAHNHAADGFPDGMTVDADGFVWSARWDGNRLVRYTPDGILVQEIIFPVRKVSSVVFGGPDYADIYVSTAGGNEKPTDGVHAGALFRVRVPGVRGVPEFFSRIRIP